MEVKDVVLQGCMLQARFLISTEESYDDTYYGTITRKRITINNELTFQVQFIKILELNRNPNYQIAMHFAKKPQDYRNYILKVSSKELKITNKTLRNDDGTWCIIYTSRAPIPSEFNVTVILETVDRECHTIYDDDVLTDFELRCEEGSVKVHKAVLAMSSPVLMRELTTDWLETKQGYVDIPDTSRATLQHFKDAIYLHVLPDTGVEQLLLLASYYMMPELEQKCVEKLIATVTAQNALYLLEFAVQQRMTKLHLALLRCIQSSAIKVEDIEREVDGKVQRNLLKMENNKKK